MIGGDQMLFYLQCIVSVSDLVFYRDIGNNICCSFRTRCGICLVWSFLNWYRVIFLSRWSFSGCRWCTSLPKYDFLTLSSIAHTTPSLLGRSFSIIPRFHKALFRSSTLMITKISNFDLLLFSMNYFTLSYRWDIRVSTSNKLLLYTSWKIMLSS